MAGGADSEGTADEGGGERSADERTAVGRRNGRRDGRTSKLEERSGRGGEVFSRDRFIQSPIGMERVSREIVGFRGVSVHANFVPA